MINFIKKWVFWVWNPAFFTIRDSNGKIIDDWSRRKHSKEVMGKLKSGELKLHGFHGAKINYKEGDKPKCYKVESKGKVVLKKQD